MNDKLKKKKVKRMSEADFWLQELRKASRLRRTMTTLDRQAREGLARLAGGA